MNRQGRIYNIIHKMTRDHYYSICNMKYHLANVSGYLTSLLISLAGITLFELQIFLLQQSIHYKVNIFELCQIEGRVTMTPERWWCLFLLYFFLVMCIKYFSLLHYPFLLSLLKIPACFTILYFLYHWFPLVLILVTTEIKFQCSVTY